MIANGMRVDPVQSVPDLRLFGVSLGHVSGLQQLCCCFLAVCFWFLIQGVMQESFTSAGFKLPWTAGFLEMLFFTAFSLVETTFTKRRRSQSSDAEEDDKDLEAGVKLMEYHSKDRGQGASGADGGDSEGVGQGGDSNASAAVPIGAYVVVAGGLTAARGLSWIMISTLSFPTSLLIKSSKLVAVMVGGVLFLRKRYGLWDYGAAVLITIGLVLFTKGDMSTKPSSQDTWFGLAAGFLSLGADSLVSNMQERTLRASKRSVVEMLLYTNAMSTVFFLFIVVGSGEAGPALDFFADNPRAATWLCGAAVAGYFGLAAWTTVIKAFGALVATGIGILRKFGNLAFSFYLFPKPFVWLHAVGLGLFFYGLWVSYWRSKVRTAQGGGPGGDR